ncbi:MAG: polysaccharide deacetylase family protein [Alphaproteobacteria bacterium]|nr:polysaccharide deacetylase family protein [Alphaproteobacteria bacterium]
MRHSFMQICLALLLALTALIRPGFAAGLPVDESSAVVLSYSRIGEDAYAATNLRLDQFHEHLEEFKSERINVMPLPEILTAVSAQTPLPEHTLAITFSGAFKSAYENAMKPLLEADIPFTVFFASDNADTDAGQHLNWKELKALSENPLVSFGLLPASYTRLSAEDDSEILRQINKARTRTREELAIEPKIFSYPFGEYSARYKTLIKDQGFTAAFGLHSGSIYAGADMYALPRFSMTERYGNLDRFELVMNALPLPATEIEPQDPFLENTMPAIGFTVTPALAENLGNLSCFISEQNAPTIEKLGENRIELRLHEALSEERTRVNCTIPAGDDRWRWLGMLLVLRENAESPTLVDEEILTSQPDALP